MSSVSQGLDVSRQELSALLAARAGPPPAAPQLAAAFLAARRSHGRSAARERAQPALAPHSASPAGGDHPVVSLLGALKRHGL